MSAACAEFPEVSVQGHLLLTKLGYDVDIVVEAPARPSGPATPPSAASLVMANQEQTHIGSSLDSSRRRDVRGNARWPSSKRSSGNAPKRRDYGSQVRRDGT
jgi:hypothetical protein